MKYLPFLFFLGACNQLKEKGFEVHLPIPLPYEHTPQDALPSQKGTIVTYRW